MSGHSKWAQIKRSKGAKDAKRGALFSKLSKKITIAAKSGSPDPSLNFQLRTEIENAKAEGMPSDNIERAIKKASDKDSSQLTEALYEGYGPFGTAFLVEAATDNTNRAVGNIKHIFSKHNGSLGAIGSVAWQFETKGQILIEPVSNLAEIELAAIDAGATDVINTENGLEIHTSPENLHRIKLELENLGCKIAQSDIIKESTQPTELTESQKETIINLFTELEDNEDVTAVHSSAIL